jgi:hypothetical protein
MLYNRFWAPARKALSEGGFHPCSSSALVRERIDGALASTHLSYLR